MDSRLQLARALFYFNSYHKNMATHTSARDEMYLQTTTMIYNTNTSNDNNTHKCMERDRRIEGKRRHSCNHPLSFAKIYLLLQMVFFILISDTGLPYHDQSSSSWWSSSPSSLRHQPLNHHQRQFSTFFVRGETTNHTLMKQYHMNQSTVTNSSAPSSPLSPLAQKRAEAASFLSLATAIEAKGTAAMNATMAASLVSQLESQTKVLADLKLQQKTGMGVGTTAETKELIVITTGMIAVACLATFRIVTRWIHGWTMGRKMGIQRQNFAAMYTHYLNSAQRFSDVVNEQISDYDQHITEWDLEFKQLLRDVVEPPFEGEGKKVVDGVSSALRKLKLAQFEAMANSNGDDGDDDSTVTGEGEVPGSEAFRFNPQDTSTHPLDSVLYHYNKALTVDEYCLFHFLPERSLMRGTNLDNCDVEQWQAMKQDPAAIAPRKSPMLDLLLPPRLGVTLQMMNQHFETQRQFSNVNREQIHDYGNDPIDNLDIQTENKWWENIQGAVKTKLKDAKRMLSVAGEKFGVAYVSTQCIVC